MFLYAKAVCYAIECGKMDAVCLVHGWFFSIHPSLVQQWNDSKRILNCVCSFRCLCVLVGFIQCGCMGWRNMEPNHALQCGYTTPFLFCWTWRNENVWCMGLPDGYSYSFYILQNRGGRKVRQFIGCNSALLFKTRSVVWHNGEAFFANVSTVLSKWEKIQGSKSWCVFACCFFESLQAVRSASF